MTFPALIYSIFNFSVHQSQQLTYVYDSADTLKVNSCDVLTSHPCTPNNYDNKSQVTVNDTGVQLKLRANKRIFIGSYNPTEQK